MNLHAPWTDVGSLQSDISSLRDELRRKANDYDVSSLVRRVDSLEHTVRELGSTVDGFQSRLYEVEEHFIQIEAAILSKKASE